MDLVLLNQKEFTAHQLPLENQNVHLWQYLLQLLYLVNMNFNLKLLELKELSLKEALLIQLQKKYIQDLGQELMKYNCKKAVLNFYFQRVRDMILQNKLKEYPDPFMKFKKNLKLHNTLSENSKDNEYYLIIKINSLMMTDKNNNYEN